MQVRTAIPNDYIQVEKLWLELNKYHAGLEPNLIKEVDTYLSEQDYLDVINDSNQDILVLESNNAILAAVWLVERKHEGGQAIPMPIAFIQEICVSKDKQRQRLGQTLMAEIEKWAKKRDLNEIEFNVWSQNKMALSFYEKLGFRYTRNEMSKPVT